MSKEFSTFMDGYDCKECDDYIKRIKQLESQNKKLKDCLENCKKAIIENATDTVWFTYYETVVDYITSVLEEIKK